MSNDVIEGEYFAPGETIRDLVLNDAVETRYAYCNTCRLIFRASGSADCPLCYKGIDLSCTGEVEYYTIWNGDMVTDFLQLLLLR